MHKFIFFVAVLIFYLSLLFCGRRLTVKTYSIQTEKLQRKIRIAQLADLHGNLFGEENERLLLALDEQKPDVIVFTGDNIKDKTPIDAIEPFLKKIGEKWPCYYVFGNHEHRYQLTEQEAQMMTRCGVVDLNDKTAELLDSAVCLCGVNDPLNDKANFSARLAKLDAQCDRTKFTVLLSHRPESAKLYTRFGFDLVLSGHAHGGQWRLPGLINGLYTPNQGLFPKYAGGRYDFERQTLIVSRGLATQYIIPRIFNPTELVVIDLLPIKG